MSKPIYISDELHRRLKFLALERGISLTELVTKILAAFNLKEKK